MRCLLAREGSGLLWGLLSLLLCIGLCTPSGCDKMGDPAEKNKKIIVPPDDPYELTNTKGDPDIPKPDKGEGMKESKKGVIDDPYEVPK